MRNSAHRKPTRTLWNEVLWQNSSLGSLVARLVSNHLQWTYWALAWESLWVAYAGSRHLARGRTSMQRIKLVTLTGSCNSKESQLWCKQRRRLCSKWYNLMKSCSWIKVSVIQVWLRRCSRQKRKWEKVWSQVTIQALLTRAEVLSRSLKSQATSALLQVCVQSAKKKALKN